MNLKLLHFLTAISILLWPIQLLAHEAENEYLNCLQKEIIGASSEKTVGELQANCTQMVLDTDDEADTVAEEIELSTAAVATNPFTLLQHKSNYLLPVAYSLSQDGVGLSGLSEEADPDEAEVKFQLSFKTLLRQDIFGINAKLYSAYTNTSWWQAYNSGESRPFRETNHEPEIFLDIPTNLLFASWELDSLKFGLSHLSNGRSEMFSRSWNRFYSEFLISSQNNILRLKPWISVSDLEDNPDIEQFRGRGEIAGSHFIGDHIFNWQLRHTFDSNNRASIETDWSFPLKGREDLRVFLQYFNGYGETLIDFNQKSERIGMGFKFGG